MDEKKVPKLRFEGFVQDWEQRKSSSLMSFSNGINAPKENYGKGRKMISVMDILDEQPIKYEYIRNSVQVDAKIESKNKIEYGDLVFVRSSEVPEEVGWAKAYLEEEYALYSGFSIRGKKINEFNPYFVELTLNSINRKQIERKAGGSTRFNVSQTILNSLELLMPKIEEQNKIDKFFKQLDDTIALHQDKLNKLKRLKKGFLQVLFANKTTSPKVRFAKFNEEWEQRKLGELAESFEYGLNASAKKFDGSNKYIRITDIDDISHKFNQSGVTSPDIDFANADNYKLKKGDILFARTGASVGKTYIYRESDGLVYYAGFLIRARIKSKISSEFVFQTTFNDSYNQFIKITSQRSGQPGVNAEEYSNFKIMIPNYEEQNAIGCFFKKVDDTITLNQKKISSLKQLKKAFLQLMFI